MVTEIAQITIDPSQAAGFEAAVAQAAPLFRAARGCHGMALERTVEDPARYRLVVRWETREDHTVAFRGSPAFLEWRALAGPFFKAPPVVEHTLSVGNYFG